MISLPTKQGTVANGYSPTLTLILTLTLTLTHPGLFNNTNISEFPSGNGDD